MITLRWSGFVLLVALSALGAGGAGCAGQSGAGPGGGPGATPTVPAAAVPVSITRTGGFAGVNQTIEIAADGSWVYTDGRRNVTERGELTADQRLLLTQLVASPAFADQLSQATPPGVCSDAFGYTVTFGAKSASFEDCGDQDRPAVESAIAVITQATPF